MLFRSADTSNAPSAKAAAKLAMMHEYPANKQRSFRELTAFATGGFAESAAKPIPALPSFLTVLFAEVKQATDDISVR